jgi:hypothetical protein
MLPRPVAKYHIQPTILLLSTQEDLAWPATPPKRKKPKSKHQQQVEPPTPPKTPEKAQEVSSMSDKVNEYIIPL